MTTSIGVSHLSLPKTFPAIDDQKERKLPLRKYPPIGSLDTVKGFRNDQGKLIFTSAHGTCNIFKDEEILKYYDVIRSELFGERMNVYGEKEEVYIDFTQNNKAIIQQQATRGCTAAVAAMLIKDRGGEPSLYALQERNLGDNEDIQKDIQLAGFEPITTSIKSKSLESLKTQLVNYGSAVITISDPQVGAHSIVIDEVSEDLQRVRLRDPYHGWEIAISAEAFQLRWESKTTIQIGNEVTCVSSQKDHLDDNDLNAWSDFWRRDGLYLQLAKNYPF